MSTSHHGPDPDMDPIVSRSLLALAVGVALIPNARKPARLHMGDERASLCSRSRGSAPSHRGDWGDVSGGWCEDDAQQDQGDTDR